MYNILRLKESGFLCFILLVYSIYFILRKEQALYGYCKIGYLMEDLCLSGYCKIVYLMEVLGLCGICKIKLFNGGSGSLWLL